MYDNDPKHIANVIIAYLDNVMVKKARQRVQVQVVMSNSVTGIIQTLCLPYKQYFHVCLHIFNKSVHLFEI